MYLKQSIFYNGGHVSRVINTCWRLVKNDISFSNFLSFNRQYKRKKRWRREAQRQWSLNFHLRQSHRHITSILPNMIIFFRFFIILTIFIIFSLSTFWSYHLPDIHLRIIFHSHNIHLYHYHLTHFITCTTIIIFFFFNFIQLSFTCMTFFFCSILQIPNIHLCHHLFLLTHHLHDIPHIL